MKKVVGSLLLILTWPFKFLKKSKIDNFVGGLIFGAIFSLVVNIITVQVQELVNKQRILEAIENEIVNNTIIAKGVIEENTKSIDKKEAYNPFYTLRYYSKDLWTQSSEPLQYVAQLSQESQIAISGYYTYTISEHNRMTDSLEKLTSPHLIYCNDIDLNKGLANKGECDTWNHILLNSERSTAIVVGRYPIN